METASAGSVSCWRKVASNRGRCSSQRVLSCLGNRSFLSPGISPDRLLPVVNTGDVVALHAISELGRGDRLESWLPPANRVVEQIESALQRRNMQASQICVLAGLQIPDHGLQT
jgi:hypothetical protein